MVVVDRRVPSANVDAVRCDSEQGAYEMTRYLLDLGHRRIALLTGPAGVSTAQDRVNGYRRALHEFGLNGSDDLVVYGEFAPASGYRMAQQVLDLPHRPTALFAANNFIAAGAYRAVRDAGLEIPADLTMVAFDDLPAGLAVEPFMTVIEQPAYEMGSRAAELLFARLSGHTPPNVRKSSCPSA